MSRDTCHNYAKVVAARGNGREAPIGHTLTERQHHSGFIKTDCSLSCKLNGVSHPIETGVESIAN